MRRIRVYDDRGQNMHRVGTHEHIPSDLTTEEVLKRFGISKHLRVYEDVDGHSRTIQPFSEWPAERFA